LFRIRGRTLDEPTRVASTFGGDQDPLRVQPSMMQRKPIPILTDQVLLCNDKVWIKSLVVAWSTIVSRYSHRVVRASNSIGSECWNRFFHSF
jgi:hypothetical protein